MQSKDSSGGFASARSVMIESQLRPQGIIDPAILGAFGSIAREDFAPEGGRPLAYSDRSVPLGDGRAMMPSAALAALVQALEPVAGERALVIAAAGGYSSAVLETLGLAVSVTEKPSGSADGGPYDVILIDGAVEAIPDKAVAQLADGGRLAAAIGQGPVSRLVVGTKIGGAFGVRGIGDASVPPIPGFAKPRSFVFQA